MLRLHRLVIAACIGIGLTAGAVVDPVAAAPTTGTVQSNYTVRAGDYLSGIAMKLNVSLKDLLQVNGMTTSSLILPGMQLKVPSKGSSVAAAPKTTAATPKAPASSTYTVVSGDYLTGIAAKLKVSTTALLKTNSLQLNSLIWPGMQLKVPTGGVVPASATPTTTSAPKATTPKPAASAAAYTVVRNDSLSGIAQKLGVKLSSLLTTNQMTVSSLIYPGMQLKVPAGAKVPAAPAPATSSTVTSTTTPTAGPVPAPYTGSVPAKVQTVLSFARAQLGKPYKFNTAGPNSYDCSGLTLAAYATIGIDLPHYSGAQMAFGTVVDWTTEAIRPGDLVFLETAVGSGIIGHVGIATGSNTWIQAPRTGDVIREGSFTTTRVVGVRRLVAD